VPGYKGHIVGAVVCNTVYAGAIAVSPHFVAANTHNIVSDMELLVGLFVVAILFGLFPDIDTNSKGQHIFYLVALVADIWLITDGRMVAAAFLGLLAMTPIVGKHRGWTHSKLAMFLVPSPIIILPYLYNSRLLSLALIIYGAAFTGYFSHLLFDGCITKLIHIKGASRY
jgi:membrane-bound metal-dependent hydrolase YbcI (DUF457 family)